LIVPIRVIGGERLRSPHTSIKIKFKEINMGYSIDSKVGELLDNAAPRAVIDKHMPELATNPQIGMARGMSLKMIAGFSGGKITKEMLAAVNDDLQKI